MQKDSTKEIFGRFYYYTQTVLGGQSPREACQIFRALKWTSLSFWSCDDGYKVTNYIIGKMVGKENKVC